VSTLLVTVILVVGCCANVGADREAEIWGSRDAWGALEGEPVDWAYVEDEKIATVLLKYLLVYPSGWHMIPANAALPVERVSAFRVERSCRDSEMVVFCGGILLIGERFIETSWEETKFLQSATNALPSDRGSE